ncbi:outer membrane lipoprotein LolB [Undibacterium fentianense]|uniref:Outer-membrane lipoprotein LolB n=1 Tax=Undibacterium fentianense TaxID=2828728 RepID=A0A941E790_9BURK|nr:outer membrane lipoprotein LolB [Undibacterium fentianense]MBR7801028.1 outer membrane lipoprotein LolB [Undibacterium fentianense]
MACSTTQPLLTSKTNIHRQWQNDLQLNGRISVQYQQNEATETLTGSFEWQQTSQDLQIHLRSPLGQTIATIFENSEGARLEQAKQPPRYAQNIEQLLSENFAWSIPAQGLKAWLQGLHFDEKGQPQMVLAQDYTTIQSRGWMVQFVSWQDVDGVTRPKRIDLQRNTEDMGEIKVRIITEWK